MRYFIELTPKRRTLRLTAALVVALLAVGIDPGRLVAQGDPYTLDDVRLWISSGVKTTRILRLVQGRCLAFRIDGDAEAELRRAGAEDALVNGLRSSCQRPPQVAVAPPPPPPPQRSEPSTVGRETPSRYSRRVLYPIYYGRPSIATVFGGLMTPEWKGTDAGTHQVSLPNGEEVRVRMPEAPASLLTYGFSVGSAGGLRLEVEGYFHQTDFPTLLMGPAVEPFLPLGRTRFRMILGATGWLSVAGQHMEVIDETGAETSDTLSVVSFGAGGDGRVGLAYHPKPGMWIFAEARYRWADTFYRYADVSPTEYVEDFPWPKLGVRGPSVRIGIGF
ncbi:MAG TPA: hypothetical protein VGB24_01255 [Longimicrobium sp.]|uniref:hypothetical protein n=1 Tax=Longimicrobium sp. TaxID=2029185 RepID=UPI002EDA3EC6